MIILLLLISNKINKEIETEPLKEYYQTLKKNQII